MYPPNVLVAPRLLDCVPPYVNSPFTSYIPPPVSLCLPLPAPSHLHPPHPPCNAQSCLGLHQVMRWRRRTDPEVQVLAEAEQLRPHTREAACVASQHCVHHAVTVVFFFHFCILATCHRQTLGPCDREVL